MEQQQHHYRIWDKERGSMAPMDKPGVLSIYQSAEGVSGYTYYYNAKGQQVHCNDIEVMQCTGLKDKNGTPIFKGDILGLLKGKDLQGNPAMARYEVVWRKSGFYGRLIPRGSEQSDYSSLYWFQASIEVIGNIYESPQILEAA